MTQLEKDTKRHFKKITNALKCSGSCFCDVVDLIDKNISKWRDKASDRKYSDPYETFGDEDEEFQRELDKLGNKRRIARRLWRVKEIDRLMKEIIGDMEKNIESADCDDEDADI